MGCIVQNQSCVSAVLCAYKKYECSQTQCMDHITPSAVELNTKSTRLVQWLYQGETFKGEEIFWGLFPWQSLLQREEKHKT